MRVSWTCQLSSFVSQRTHLCSTWKMRYDCRSTVIPFIFTIVKSNVSKSTSEKINKCNLPQTISCVDENTPSRCIVLPLVVMHDAALWLMHASSCMSLHTCTYIRSKLYKLHLKRDCSCPLWTFTKLNLTSSLTPRSLSPTPTSPCSPCSPLHAFHFWR